MGGSIRNKGGEGNSRPQSAPPPPIPTPLFTLSPPPKNISGVSATDASCYALYSLGVRYTSISIVTNF